MRDMNSLSAQEMERLADLASDIMVLCEGSRLPLDCALIAMAQAFGTALAFDAEPRLTMRDLGDMVVRSTEHAQAAFADGSLVRGWGVLG